MSISNFALASSSLSNPAKGSSKPLNQNSIFVGIVTRVAGAQVIVSIPKLNAITEFGPCDVYGALPEVGDRVLCSYIDNRFDHLVVMGTLAGTNDTRDLQIELYMEVI